MNIPECKLALVGFGRWGRNHARVLNELSALALICDSDPSRLAEARSSYPGVATVSTLADVANSDVDGVVVATPAPTHAEAALLLLEHSKHVFVEKPLALTLAEGAKVVAFAEQTGRVLQVGHILEYHPVRAQIFELLESGTLGRLLSARLVRTNLGTIRDAEDVLFSFAPHDIAFALALAGRLPASVTAAGFDLLDRQMADTGTLVLDFDGPAKFKVQICVSWLEPKKEHRSLLVGSDGMLEWNDTKGHRSLTLFRTELDRASGVPAARLVGTEEIPLRDGEPLKLELVDFILAIKDGTVPRADARSGLDVLTVLEACRKSIKEGRKIMVEELERDYFAHESAEVHPTAQVGAGSMIWHNCHIMKNSVIGRDVILGQNCFVAADVRIGDGTRVQNNVSVYAGVELAEDVFVGPSAVFTNVRYPRAFVSRKTEFEKTTVGRGATVGANATVVCGTTIGEFGFVAAGAVVTRDVPPHTLVEGVPAVRSGFMCRCGERLEFVDVGDTACRRCGLEYRKSGPDLTLIAAE